MTLYILDTDTISLYQDGDPAVLANILRRGGHRLVVTGTTVEEVLGGWLHRVRIAKTNPDRAFGYAQYAESVEALSGWPVLQPIRVGSNRGRQSGHRVGRPAVQPA